ncbi:Sarcosine oxidase, delta subunit, heterotetrameric [Fulvimarina pelagi HTCC2506]|uniref:Sarcosine oxidase, delta subunit, heterotetrameric n=1 Tax=Fulvimarina pelagi HTCC2506 TaxID=314231 RepID=Q0G2T7_9HYPH|nr:sarcosine oxidase subunit delta [Fulvimarina pelagi]EAU42094.1 Sarcosine oxidase, delta subunit, heterotetrameric [Fulvimarina pelagi HTCC2506]
MRIDCPHCGSRDIQEFVYRGDASVSRPDPDGEDALKHFVDAVHLRTNPAGFHSEHWYHSGGCRSWVTVVRDTLTHEIESVGFANEEIDR